MPDIRIIIPALDEAPAIGAVVLGAKQHAREVIVVDNGSTDDTASLARAAGARVVREPHRGYGRACLAGIAAAGAADVLVFLDGDAADDTSMIPLLCEPVLSRDADLVLSSRVAGAQPGALTLAQRWGNRLACTLIRLLWGARFTDLGPMRAISPAALARLHMSAPTWAWTIQMQLRAVGAGLRCIEIDVPYRRRIGHSKVSGTVRGTLLAGTWIIATILRERISSPVASGRRSSGGDDPLKSTKAPNVSSATTTDVFEIIHSTRAMRRLKPDPVPDELIQQVLQAGVCGASGGNKQNWGFIVVRDADIKRRIQHYYQRALDEVIGPHYASSAPPPGVTAEQFRRQHAAVEYLTTHFHEAPVWIVACLDSGAGRPNRGSGASIYPAVQNMLLACRALGLGATLTNRHLLHGQAVDDILELPDGVHSYAIVPIGYPMGRFGPVRRSLEGVVHHNRWGNTEPAATSANNTNS